MSIENLRIGDLIVRQKGPFSTHFIVYVGIHGGQHTVAENQNGVGVRYTTLRRALSGNSIKRFERFGGTEAQRSMVIPRINQMVGKPYDLVLFNCEHFARWIASGRIESKQVRKASTAAMIGGGLMLLSKSPAMKAFGVFGIALGIIGHLSQK